MKPPKPPPVHWRLPFLRKHASWPVLLGWGGTIVIGVAFLIGAVVLLGWWGALAIGAVLIAWFIWEVRKTP